MFTLQDFADIYCTSIRTINRRITKILPFFKDFDLKRRKHFYTIEEAKQIIKSIGIPPNNKFNGQIKAQYPELF